MNRHHRQNRSDEPVTPVAEQNIARLIGDCYCAEQPDADFVHQTRRRMLDACMEAPSPAPRERPGRRDTAAVRLSLWRALPWAALAAAVLLGVGLWLGSQLSRPAAPIEIVRVDEPNGAGRAAWRPAPEMIGAGLTPAAAPEATPPVPVEIGQPVRTEAGQRRRIALADGSVIYMKEGTALTPLSRRHVKLDRGSVFVEVAPMASADGGRVTFTLETPGRTVRALGTRFAVDADGDRFRVAVTQGKVAVSGVAAPVHAGRQIRAEAGQLREEAIPRASAMLAWTKDLMAAAGAALVPASEHRGGALIAVDPNGQEARLSMRRYHVDVVIEDGFARTTIDQTYFNHMPWRLEGTFYFPLPADASISRLAMYVNGKLMEGGMAEREYARHVFEDIMHTRRDPALLEWLDGTTFKMRVFPLEGRQEKRIILSYTQRLSNEYGQMSYYFPTGHTMETVGRWSFRARVVGGENVPWQSRVKDIEATSNDAGDLIVTASGQGLMPRHDFDLTISPTGQLGLDDQPQFGSFDHEKHRYLMLRLRPRLQADTTAADTRTGPRDWIFLFESSADRDPLEARAQIEVIRHLLDHAGHDDRFAIVSAGTHVRTMSAELQPVTPETQAEAIGFLDRQHLIGALDLEAALAEASRLARDARNPHVVHVGSGVPVLGKTETADLVATLGDGATYVGVGVGKSWNRTFMKAAAGATGGYYTQINPDENIAWESFDLHATLNAPRLTDLKVTDPAGREFLLFEDAVADGQEICAVTRMDADTKLPASVTVTGKFNGGNWSRTLELADVDDGAGYLPRFWAKLEIDRLVAQNAQANKAKIIALSKAMYVMSPFTSLLVLENEAMYKKYKVDRGRKDHWSLYPAPAKIDVKYEPIGQESTSAGTDPVSTDGGVEAALRSVLIRTPVPVLYNPNCGFSHDARFITAWDAVHAAYANTVPPTWRHVIDILDSGSLVKEYQTTGGRPRWDEVPVRRRLFDDEALLPSMTLTGKSLSTEPAPPSQAGEPAASPRWILGNEQVRAKRSEAFVIGGFWTQTPAIDIPVDGLFIEPPAFLKQREPELLPDGRFSRTYLPLTHFGDGKGYLPSAWTTSVGFEWDGIPLSDGGWIHGAPAQTWSMGRYHRPVYTNQAWQHYADLIRWAPGMNTTWADIQGVAEDEAQTPEPTLGKIDPGARELIDRARKVGWRKVTFASEGGGPGLTVTFDGAGRCVWNRTVDLGLRERVVVDGQTMLHLYDEIGVGARRTLNRFHRAQLGRMLPWLVGSADDLARGADLRKVGLREVAVVPVRDEDAPEQWVELRLTFNEDGTLARRRWIERPSGKTLLSQVFGTDSQVGPQGERILWLDGEGKQIGEMSVSLKRTEAPSMDPAAEELVVVSLPYRTPEYLRAKHNLGSTDNAAKWPEQVAVDMIASLAAQNKYEAMTIMSKRFAETGQSKPGLYTLMISGLLMWNPDQPASNLGVSEPLNPVKAHPDSPVARYVAYRLEGHRVHDWPKIREPENMGDGYLSNMAWLYYGARRWPSEYASGDRKSRDRIVKILDKVVDKVGPHELTWGLVEAVRATGLQVEQFSQVRKAYQKFADDPGLGHAARYEAAVLAAHSPSGQQTAAKELRKLWRESVEAGVCPMVDANFPNIMASQPEQLPGGQASNSFQVEVKWAIETLSANRKPFQLCHLAWLLRTLGEQHNAHQALQAALRVAGPEEDTLVRLTVVQYGMRSADYALAEQAIEPLLENEELGESPDFWRLAGTVAQYRGQSGRAILCLERAVELEAQQGSAVVNLQQLRSDHTQLLGWYQTLAGGAEILGDEARQNLVRRTVRTADRWRGIDPEDSQACKLAGDTLTALGEDELAWEYLTSPLAGRVGEAKPWTDLGRQLEQQGQLELAIRAYSAAFSHEQTNAQLLMSKADLLSRMGRRDQARQVYRKVAEGNWPRQWNGVKARAQRILRGY